MPTGEGPRADRLESEFSADPEMRELIELFVGELAARVQALESASASGDGGQIARLAHQLRGAAGGYGFPTIGQAAARVETVAAQAVGAGASLEPVLTELRELIALCRSAIAGVSGGRRGAA